jgi:betaine-aldehyde dehydrogenase
VLGLYYGGAYRDATSGATFSTTNPATREVIAEVQQATPADVDAAVQAAREGFAVWSRMSGAERGRILHRASRILREKNDELAHLEVQDTGKPIAEASVVDVVSGADCIEYFAGLAATLHGEHYDLSGSFAYTRREPLGVCAGIGAWNYPLQIACWKAAPALACGNTMVFKPSPLTPLTALKLAEVFTEAGAPAGVFNVVQGHTEVGRALVAHPDVRKVSLTGSVPTGRRVMADAAATLKHVTMELGGKSPLIVFDDADLDNAVSGALMANFYTQGEICSNGTRVFVHRDVRESFVARVVERTEKMIVGDPMDPKTQIGALIGEEHLARVLEFVAKGASEGAQLRCGGRRVEGLPGSFMRPAVFDGCRDDMTIVREEIFGPVMAVLEFGDEDEAVRRANATEYGLAAGVFTKDLNRAHRVAAALEAGTVWINNYNVSPIEVPFGGYKQSGLGRENSLATIEHYTQLKTVYVELGDVEAPF